MKRRAFLQAVASTALVATVAPGVLLGPVEAVTPTPPLDLAVQGMWDEFNRAAREASRSAKRLAEVMRESAEALSAFHPPPWTPNCRCMLIDIVPEDVKELAK